MGNWGPLCNSNWKEDDGGGFRDVDIRLDVWGQNRIWECASILDMNLKLLLCPLHILFVFFGCQFGHFHYLITRITAPKCDYSTLIGE